MNLILREQDMAKYTAQIGGHSWANGPIAEFRTLTAAREWAEEYGTTADWCRISDSSGKVVAEHRRDPSGDGTKWFQAAI